MNAHQPEGAAPSWRANPRTLYWRGVQQGRQQSWTAVSPGSYVIGIATRWTLRVAMHHRTLSASMINSAPPISRLSAIPPTIERTRYRRSAGLAPASVPAAALCATAIPIQKSRMDQPPQRWSKSDILAQPARRRTRSRECSERIADGRVHRRLIPVGEFGTEQGFAPQCPDDAAEDGRQRQQRGKCDDEALVAEVCEDGEEREPQYEAAQDLARRELRDCALRSVHGHSPICRTRQAKSPQPTSGSCATVGTVRGAGPDVASWRRCAPTNAVKMARGRLSWTASAASSNSIGISQWRDNEQSQAPSSRMSRRTVHSGSSNCTRPSAASVHAPASLSQRTRAAFADCSIRDRRVHASAAILENRSDVGAGASLSCSSNPSRRSSRLGSSSMTPSRTM